MHTFKCAPDLRSAPVILYLKTVMGSIEQADLVLFNFLKISFSNFEGVLVDKQGGLITLT